MGDENEPTTPADRMMEKLVVGPDGVYGLTYSGNVWEIKGHEWVPVKFHLLQGADNG